MRIIVTGATGVIGRRTVPMLVAAGHQVSAVVRSAAQGTGLRRAGARPIYVDLFDPVAMRAALDGRDVVVNLATHIPASTGRMLLPFAWRQNDRLRREASAILVDAAIAGGVRRFIQESFALVYPDRGEAWIDERTPIEPTRHNRTVADAEAAVRRFTDNGGAGIALRFAAFYGPDAFQTHDMIRLVRKGWPPLPGALDAFFSSVSHDDAAAAVVAALDLRAGTYNVADDEPLRRGEFASCLAAALDVAAPRPLPHWLARLAGSASVGELMSRSQRISNRKLRAESSWAPSYVSVREGWHAIVAALGGAGAPSRNIYGKASRSPDEDAERGSPSTDAPAGSAGTWNRCDCGRTAGREAPPSTRGPLQADR